MSAPTYIDCWHFACDKLRDGRDLPKKGDVLKHDRPVVPCESGLHGSVRAIDALNYAPGSMVARVRLSGQIKSHGDSIDKYAASERENLTEYVDMSKVLREFACAVATKAMDDCEKLGQKIAPESRKAVEVAKAYARGEATDGELQAARSAAYWAAYSAAGCASDAACSAADCAADAAYSAADCASDAACSDQNDLLESMLNAELQRVNA